MRDGLEAAAKIGLESLKNPGQAILPEDFANKTDKIRNTLIEGLGLSFSARSVCGSYNKNGTPKRPVLVGFGSSKVNPTLLNLPPRLPACLSPRGR
jgi:hypothetical protein